MTDGTSADGVGPPVIRLDAVTVMTWTDEPGRPGKVTVNTVGDADAVEPVSVADGVPDALEVVSSGELVATGLDAIELGTVVVPTVSVKLAVTIE